MANNLWAQLNWKYDEGCFWCTEKNEKKLNFGLTENEKSLPSSLLGLAKTSNRSKINDLWKEFILFIKLGVDRNNGCYTMSLRFYFRSHQQGFVYWYALVFWTEEFGSISFLTDWNRLLEYASDKDKYWQ